MTRARTISAQNRKREVQRLEKFLESTGIKLSSIASDLVGGFVPSDAERASCR